jgi:5-formyltetrahydrofolate cyclo-ligase
MPVDDEKERLRTVARARRRTAAEQVGSTAGQALKDHFRAARAAMGVPSTPDEDWRAVAGYWPMETEMDPRPLLRHLHGRGFDCALPVVVGRGRALHFRRWHPQTVLEPAGFGLLELPRSAPRVTPQVVLAPLLCFDDRGVRLGHGAGYYDYTLAALRRAGSVLAVGIAFADQQVDRVPDADHDQRLDWIVTEKGAIQVTADQPGGPTPVMNATPS